MAEIHDAFVRDQTKSIRRASVNLQPNTQSGTKILHLYAYNVEIVRGVQWTDYGTRRDFAVDTDDAYRNRPIFPDEATFHLLGYTNEWNRGARKSRFKERDSSKLNVWC